MSWWSSAVGQTAEITRVFTSEDIVAYNRLAGDTVETHQVPEPLIAGLFSTLLGVDLPGFGTNYLKQSMTFLAYAEVDEQLRAVVTVTSVRPEKRLVRLSTNCLAADGRVICQGEALVLAAGQTDGDEPNSETRQDSYDTVGRTHDE